ncbi:MAG: hypothetical protein NZR01_02300 [Bryobacteraceae bacterium]|nr:hypothetical protein [Bryobacteraceae bacterium]
MKEYLERLQVGDPAEFQGLAMLPIAGAEPAQGEPAYILLEDAVRSGVAKVEELPSASVPEIAVENLSDRPVLILGGEELVGARQNRILNLTILAPPRQRTVVPVSCVEAGRWRPVSPRFHPTPSVAFGKLRAESTAHVTASMRAGIGRRTNQAAVWMAVDEKLERLGVQSPTSAMREAFARHERDVEEYVRRLPWGEGQTGAVFAIDGRPAGIDLFDHPNTCQRMLPKLVRGYALDAMEKRYWAGTGTDEKSAAGSGAESTDLLAAALRAWIASVGEAETLIQPAIGLGQDVRMESATITGAALWVDDRYVHLCAFPARTKADPRRRSSIRRHLWWNPVDSQSGAE